jgi:hypothetical protein
MTSEILKNDCSGHLSYWLRHAGWGMYVYDPADDGPEVETIVSILISHPELRVMLPAWLGRPLLD